MKAPIYAGRDVLVTGGTGFIGRHLLRQLVSEGARAVTFARGDARMAGAEHIRGDVCDAQAVNALIERRFDAVFHLAGASGQDKPDAGARRATNCDGLNNVLEAIRRISPETTLCFASSRLVYGRTVYVPVDEEHPERPRSAYAADKRDGEAYCAYYASRWGVRSVALRFANPYGPHLLTDHRRYNVANWMIDELCRGGAVSVYGRGEQLRDYVYVDDAVRALVLAASSEAAHGRIFNVGSGAGTALVEFVRAGMLAAGGGSVRRLRWPAHALSVETGDYVADVSRIGAELGWYPTVSLMEGVSRTVDAQRRLIKGAGARRRDAGRIDQDEEFEQEAAA